MMWSGTAGIASIDTASHPPHSAAALDRQQFCHGIDIGRVRCSFAAFDIIILFVVRAPWS
jgi:hypothetical protein